MNTTVDNPQAVEINDRSLSLLLVEDNELDVELVKHYLKRSALNIPLVWAQHGEEGLQIIRKVYSQPDRLNRYVVLLDLNMPRMDGFEMLRELHKEPWFDELIIHVLSTSDQTTDREQAQKLGVKNYFQKPVTEALLQKVIKAADR